MANQEDLQNTCSKRNGKSNKKRQDPIHGNLYQLKLLMLFLFRGHCKKYKFRLRTEETEAAKKFDDVVFENCNTKGFRLLQAKHRLDDSETIDANSLLTDSDSDYSLIKYFFSYQDSKKEKLFKYGVIEDVIIYTNINLDFKDLENRGIEIEEVVTEDYILDIKSDKKQFKRYKCKDTQKIISLLKPKCENYNLTRLARRLATCILTGSDIKHHEPNDIFKDYHIALAKDVINVAKGKNIHKFHDTFINDEDLSAEAKQFRKVFKEELEKQSINEIRLEEINDAIINGKILNSKKINLKLSKNFGLFKDKKIGTKKNKQTNSEEKKEIDVKGNEETVSKKNDEIELDKNQGWPNNIISDSEIKDYLQHLVLAVNQPNEEELGEIIKSEIGKKYMGEYSPIATQYVHNDYIIRMLELLQGKIEKEDKYFSEIEAEAFFKEAQENIANLIVIPLTLEYCDNIEKLSIEFAERLQELDEFLNPNNDKKQVFNLINPNETTLSSIKVLQTLKNYKIPGKEELYYEKNYIFKDLDSLLSARMQDVVIKAFSSKKRLELLVIECKMRNKEELNNYSGQLDELCDKLSKILKDNGTKKIIFITQQNNQDSLINKFKGMNNSGNLEQDIFPKYVEMIDSKNHLTDLAKDSQAILLEKSKITLQGQELSLQLYANKEALIDEEFKSLINGELLMKLIKNEIKINKILVDSSYNDCYYITRIFTRSVAIKQQIEQNKEKFYIVYDEARIDSNLQDQDVVSISDRDENFKRLCVSHKSRNVHWLKRGKNKFEWQKSHGCLANLREYVDETERNIKEYKPEKIEDISENVVIISAEPGMGKSTILSHLAVQQTVAQTDSSNILWIVRINLLDHSGAFAEWQDNEIEIDITEVLNFLCRFHIDNSLEVDAIENNEEIVLKNIREGVGNLALLELKLFNYFLNQNKIVLLFDGFDEISPNYTGTIIDLLKILRDLGRVRIWITTRPYNDILSQLENELNVFPYTLKPFSEEEQKEFIERFWKNKVGLERSKNDEKFKIYIDKLLEQFSELVGYDERQFISIPLQAYMLATTFQDVFMEFHDSESERLSDEQKQKFNELLNLATLYERFIETKFYEEYMKIGLDTRKKDVITQNSNREKYSNYLNKHRKFGVLIMFGKHILEQFHPEEEVQKTVELMSNIVRGEERTGIIDRVVNNKPKFVHRTFAEYFAASYLWEQFKCISVDDYRRVFVRYNVTVYLQSDNRLQIRKFFVLIAQKDSENSKHYKYFIDGKYKLKDKVKIFLDHFISQIFEQYISDRWLFYAEDIELLMLKVVLFVFSGQEKTKIVKIINYIVQDMDFERKLFLLCACARIGCTSFADALIEVASDQLNARILQDNLRNEKIWVITPLWMAAIHSHQNFISSILFEKLCYDITWKDLRGMDLLEVIFEELDSDALRTFLKLNIIDVTQNYRCSHSERKLPLISICIPYLPLDIIELVLEKTDIHRLNKSYCGNRLIAVDCIERAIWYDKKEEDNLVSYLLKKGFDLNAGCDTGETILNVITHDFLLNLLPDCYLNDNPFFERNKYLSGIFEALRTLLEYGAIYNCESNDSQTPLQCVRKANYVVKLLTKTYKLACGTDGYTDCEVSEIFLSLICRIFDCEVTSIKQGINWELDSSQLRDNLLDVRSTIESNYQEIARIFFEGSDTVTLNIETLKDCKNEFVLEAIKTLIKFQKTYKPRDHCLNNFIDSLDVLLMEVSKFTTNEFPKLDIPEELMGLAFEIKNLDGTDYLIRGLKFLYRNVYGKEIIYTLKQMAKLPNEIEESAKLLETIDNLFNAVNNSMIDEISSMEEFWSILPYAKDRFLKAIFNVRSRVASGKYQTLSELATEYDSVGILYLLQTHYNRWKTNSSVKT